MQRSYQRLQPRGIQTRFGQSGPWRYQRRGNLRRPRLWEKSIAKRCNLRGQHAAFADDRAAGIDEQLLPLGPDIARTLDKLMSARNPAQLGILIQQRFGDALEPDVDKNLVGAARVNLQPGVNQV